MSSNTPHMKESAAPTMHADAYTVYAATTSEKQLHVLGHILQTCSTRTIYIRVVATFLIFPLFAHFHFPTSGQAVVTGIKPSPPRFLPSVFIAHRVQQSHCTSIAHRVLLTYALELYASQFVHKKKSQRIYTSMHSAGLELTKLTFTRLEVNLIRHRGDQ